MRLDGQAPNQAGKSYVDVSDPYGSRASPLTLAPF